jgi:hypothetical protein
MSEGTQRMTGGVSGTEQPPVSVAGGVGGAVTTEGTASPEGAGMPGSGTEYGTTTTTYGVPVDTDPSGSTGSATGQVGSATEQAAESGKHVAGVAREQAAGVTSEAREQTRRLMDQAGTEVRSQAQGQQQRLAGSLRSIGQELSTMCENGQQSGPATQVTRQLSEYSHQAADWLDRRDPQDVLDDVRRFARRKPGTFLAIAAVTGLVAGRLTQGLTSASQNSSGPLSGGGNGWSDPGNGYGTATGYGAGTAIPERTATVPPAVDVRDIEATGTGTLADQEYGTGTARLDRDEPLR